LLPLFLSRVDSSGVVGAAVKQHDFSVGCVLERRVPYCAKGQDQLCPDSGEKDRLELT
jgi:hypothetical protein